MERKKTKDRSGNTKKEKEAVGTVCRDRDCNIHGKLKARGKIFEGTVIKKFPRRVVIVFERMIYIRKYERYAKSKTKVHARLPECFREKINVGDYIRVRECRPLSKLIHFVVIEKIKNKGENKSK
jgi:small subunit ribosomal protein S17